MGIPIGVGGKDGREGKEGGESSCEARFGKRSSQCAKADTMEASGFCMTLATGGGLGASPRATAGKDDEHERWDSAWLQC
jgi:hypothetical protein